MLLTVKERLLLLSALPAQGNYLTMKVIADLHARLGLSEQDFKTYEIKVNDKGGATWNAEKDKGVEMEIGAEADRIICESLRKVDAQNQVTTDFFSLFDKFNPLATAEAKK
jgi:hypothetical protein